MTDDIADNRPVASPDPDHLSRLDALLEERDLEAVWLAEPNSFAWLTGGDNVVDVSAEIGVAAAGYDGAVVEVITANNEAERFREEELPEEVPVHAFDWYEESLSDAVAARSPTPAAADFDVPGFEQLEAGSLRLPLTAGDVELSRTIGAAAATAFESVCRQLTPKTTEREASALLHRSLVEAGFTVPCVLVGGARRARKHRHFTPQPVPLGECAILTAGVERGGLFDSITRMVAFDPPDWLERRHKAVSRVHATALAATQEAARNGNTAGDVFAAIVDAYEDLGYGDEWRNHHQGGAAGFAMREWIATPDSTAPIELPMSFAWNPTVRGAKSEDTILVTEDSIEPLTVTGEWPRSSYDAIGYDVAVELHDVLYR